MNALYRVFGPTHFNSSISSPVANKITLLFVGVVVTNASHLIYQAFRLSRLQSDHERKIDCEDRLYQLKNDLENDRWSVLQPAKNQRLRELTEAARLAQGLPDDHTKNTLLCHICNLYLKLDQPQLALAAAKMLTDRDKLLEFSKILRPYDSNFALIRKVRTYYGSANFQGIWDFEKLELAMKFSVIDSKLKEGVDYHIQKNVLATEKYTMYVSYAKNNPNALEPLLKFITQKKNIPTPAQSHLDLAEVYLTWNKISEVRTHLHEIIIIIQDKKIDLSESFFKQLARLIKNLPLNFQDNYKNLEGHDIVDPKYSLKRSFTKNGICTTLTDCLNENPSKILFTAVDHAKIFWIYKPTFLFYSAYNIINNLKNVNDQCEQLERFTSEFLTAFTAENKNAIKKMALKLSTKVESNDLSSRQQLIKVINLVGGANELFKEAEQALQLTFENADCFTKEQFNILHQKIKGSRTNTGTTETKNSLRKTEIAKTAFFAFSLLLSCAAPRLGVPLYIIGAIGNRFRYSF